MDEARILLLAEKYRVMLRAKGVGPCTMNHDLAPTPEQALGHCLDMTGQLEQHVAGGLHEKSLVWLGFMQGVLWALGVRRLQHLKEDNRPDGPQ